jgi:hypothetical protein
MLFTMLGWFEKITTCSLIWYKKQKYMIYKKKKTNLKNRAKIQP